MKKKQRTQDNTAFCLLMDIFVTLLGFLQAAVTINVTANDIGPDLWMGTTIYIALMITFFVGFEMYSVVLFRYKELFVTIILSSIYSFVIMITLYYIVFRVVPAVPILSVGAAVSLVLMLIWRQVRCMYLNKSKKTLKLLMIENDKGDNSRVRRMKYACLSRFDAWYEQLDVNDIEAVKVFVRDKFPLYDGICLMENIPMEARDLIVNAVTEQGKEFFVVPAAYELNFSKVRLALFDDVMVFHIHPYELDQTQAVLKRCCDILMASAGLVVLGIPMLIVALLVKTTSKGPVFYKQVRLTKNKKEFEIYKFRTMVQDAEKNSGPVFAVKDDPRVTKLGKVMRKTRLDELPQLLNVIKGDMSIVGPRPERPYFVEQFEDAIDNYGQRFMVKAGLTSLSHVYGRYSTDIADRTLYDLLYIRNYSFMLDLRIILQTTRIVFLSESSEGVTTVGQNMPEPKNAAGI